MVISIESSSSSSSSSSSDDDKNEGVVGDSSTVIPIEGLENEASLPVDYTKEAAEFAREFEEKYGYVTGYYPHFFRGTFEEVREIAKRTGKFIILYIHNENHEETELFCTQILCSEMLVDFFQGYCIGWAWDRTSETHDAALTRLMRKELYDRFYMFPSARPNSGPMLIVLGTIEGRLTVLEQFLGFIPIDEILIRLISLVENYTTRLEKIMQELEQQEVARQGREQLKREQEAAFQSSLEMDHRRTKERDELLQAEQRRQEEQLKSKAAARTRIEQLSTMISPEPAENETRPVSKLIFRLPHGEKLQRRFLAFSELEVGYIDGLI